MVFFGSVLMIISCSSQNSSVRIISENRKQNHGCISGDCKNGQGTFLWESGDVYTGQWRNGLRDGKGTMTWMDSSVYSKRSREFNNRKASSLYIPLSNTQGNSPIDITIGALGAIIGGIYIADQMKSDFITKTRMDVPDDIYIGQWRNDKRHGQGTMFLKPNYQVTGRWDNDILIVE